MTIISIWIYFNNSPSLFLNSNNIDSRDPFILLPTTLNHINQSEEDLIMQKISSEIQHIDVLDWIQKLSILPINCEDSSSFTIEEVSRNRKVSRILVDKKSRK